MFDILSITGVIFVLIATGVLTVRFGVFAPSDMGTLGKFVVNLALPALIFRAVTTRPLDEIANPGYLAAMLAGSLVVFAIGYIWSRRIAGETAQSSTFRAMGMSCANSGFVGYPVLLMALPDIAATALAMNMIVENLFMIPLVLAMAEHARGGTATGAKLAGQIALRLVRNPIVISLVLGLLVAVSGVTLPALVARPVDILAGSSAAVSLVVIGGTLATLQVRSLNLPVMVVVAGKLLLHPAAVALALVILSAIGLGVGDARLAAAAIILAATPVMSIYPILAQRYGQEQSAALAMFVMTVLSFVTISVTMAITLP